MEHHQLGQMIQRAQQGDGQAVGQIVSIYNKRLYGFFMRAVGNHHDAEDLLGEMVLRLVRTLPKYDHRGRFEPWLFRIAANLVRDRIRRIRTRPGAFSLDAANDDQAPQADVLPDTGPDVDHDMQSREQRSRLDEALAQLDETTRRMILLRHFGEMSFKEIAATFDVPIGTALARVHRGLKTLRGLLDEAS